MNKKATMQIGCFLAMFILEMIAAHCDQSSMMFNVLLILTILQIPVFVLLGYAPVLSEVSVKTDSPLTKAA